MTIGPTNGRDHVGRHLRSGRNGYDPSPMARKDRAPNPPKRPQAPQRRSSPTDPAAAARQRRSSALIAGSGVVALVIVLAIIFLTGGGDSGERAALEERRLHAAELPGPAEQVRPLGRADAGDEAEVELQRRRRAGRTIGEWAVWGSYGPRADAAREDRAQPRARWRRHPLRPGRSRGRGRQAAHLVQRDRATRTG